MTHENMPARFAKVQAMAAEADLVAILSFKPQNTFYLSGFHPGTYSHTVAVVLPTVGEPGLIIWANRTPKAKATSAVQNLYPYGKWAQEVGAANWLEAVLNALKDRDISSGRVGIEGSYVPHDFVLKLENALPDVEFVDLGELINHAREVKDEVEIAAQRDAATLTVIGMAAAEKAVAQRKSEIEIAVAAMTAMQEYWAANFPHRSAAGFGNSESGVHNTFWSYALAGPRVRMNSAPPSDTVPKEGEIVWIVVLAALDGMHAENERSFAVGTLDEEKQTAYDALMRVHEEGLKLYKPGVKCSDLFEQMADLYRANGIGDYIPGRISHGMGCGPHEEPSVGPGDEVVLAPNMVLTYEPNLRIPSFGGLQHSDMILMTEDGFEFLTTSPRGFLQV